jgi:hypothetical protein
MRERWRKLSPAQQAEEAKARKAAEPVDLHPSEDGGPYGPDPVRFPEQAQKLEEWDRAHGQERPACPKHLEWKPKKHLETQPNPPTSRCPFCREESRQQAPQVGVVEVPNPVEIASGVDRGIAAEARFTFEEKREQAEVDKAQADPESWGGRLLRSHQGRAAVRNGRFYELTQTLGLERVDELRAEEEANVLPFHPDFGEGRHYRRAAFATERGRAARRSASERHWRRYSSR